MLLTKTNKSWNVFTMAAKGERFRSMANMVMLTSKTMTLWFEPQIINKKAKFKSDLY